MRKVIFFAWFIIVVLLISGCQVSRPSGKATPQIKKSSPPTEVDIQSDVIIKIQAETSVVNVGDTITIEILIENVSNLMGAHIELQFNAAVLQAQDADSDKDGVQVQPGQFLSPDFQVDNTIDNSTGLAEYVLVQVAPSEPANGNGVIASITFEAIAAGISELTFAKADLASVDGQRIIATPVSGRVTVYD